MAQSRKIKLLREDSSHDHGKELLSVINPTFEQHSCDKEPSGKCKSQLMRFTMVNLVYLFYTIVKGFNRSKLLSVTSTIGILRLRSADWTFSFPEALFLLVTWSAKRREAARQRHFRTSSTGYENVFERDMLRSRFATKTSHSFKQPKPRNHSLLTLKNTTVVNSATKRARMVKD